MRKIRFLLFVVMLIVSLLVGCSSDVKNVKDVDNIGNNNVAYVADVKTSNKVGLGDIEMIEVDFNEVIGPYSTSEEMYRVRDKNTSLWGYVDIHTGDYVIEPQYYDAHRFSDGLAAVQNRDGLWGFNKENDVVIDFQYYDITEDQVFNNGYLVQTIVTEDYSNRYQDVMIDSNGEVVCNIHEITKDVMYYKNYGEYIHVETSSSSIFGKQRLSYPLYDSELNLISENVMAVNGNKYFVTHQDDVVKAHDFNGDILFEIEEPGWVKEFVVSDSFVLIDKDNYHSVYDLEGNVLISENDNLYIRYVSDERLIVNTVSGVKIFDVKTSTLIDTDWEYATIEYGMIVGDRFLVVGTSMTGTVGIYDLVENRSYDCSDMKGTATFILDDNIALFNYDTVVALDLSTGESVELCEPGVKVSRVGNLPVYYGNSNDGTMQYYLVRVI